MEKDMDKLKIAVCEDQKRDQEHLKEVLSQISEPAVETQFFPEAEALLKVYEPMMYDLILMDIFMTGPGLRRQKKSAGRTRISLWPLSQPARSMPCRASAFRPSVTLKNRAGKRISKSFWIRLSA